MSLCLFILLICCGLFEYRLHRYRLQKISVRIHVNGTRGKSTVTRLIHAGLRAGGYNVVAKTTGTAPRLILENGKEIPVRRRGMVSIIEQVRIVALAQKRQADVLVIECMAITPEMQYMSEHKFIQSSIGVITNIRPDHGEQLSQNLETIARALSLTIPMQGKLVTSAHLYLDLFKEVGRLRKTDIVVAPSYQFDGKTDAALSSPGADESIGQALSVCKLLGVSQADALAGMKTGSRDPGAFNVYLMEHSPYKVYLVNSFAANDPVSTCMAWEECKKKSFWVQRNDHAVIGVYVHRADRMDRLHSLAKVMTDTIPFDHLVITGQSLLLARRCFVKNGFPKNAISLLSCGLFSSSFFAQKLVQHVVAKCNKDAVLFGFGNTKDAGNHLVTYFSTKGRVVK